MVMVKTTVWTSILPEQGEVAGDIAGDLLHAQEMTAAEFGVVAKVEWKVERPDEGGDEEEIVVVVNEDDGEKSGGPVVTELGEPVGRIRPETTIAEITGGVL